MAQCYHRPQGTRRATAHCPVWVRMRCVCVRVCVRACVYVCVYMCDGSREWCASYAALQAARNDCQLSSRRKAERTPTAGAAACAVTSLSSGRLWITKRTG